MIDIFNEKRGGRRPYVRFNSYALSDGFVSMFRLVLGSFILELGLNVPPLLTLLD